MFFFNCKVVHINRRPSLQLLIVFTQVFSLEKDFTNHFSLLTSLIEFLSKCQDRTIKKDKSLRQLF
jgi:hypothetical protein